MKITRNIDFIAIDFATATGKYASICEAGICVVRNGKIVETKSWLIRPENNEYRYWNIQVHDIRPQDTINSAAFPEIWNKIEKYIIDYTIVVAHNASFDMNCLMHTLNLYNIEKPEITFYCSLTAARHIYNSTSYSLEFLCEQFEITQGIPNRAGSNAEMCARLFLKEIEDTRCTNLSEISYCSTTL